MRVGGEDKAWDTETPPKPELPPAIPRVSRLMALAIRCENLIRAGEVTDFAELARLGGVKPSTE